MGVKKFSDFKISSGVMEGEKISIDNIFNIPIVVLSFRIEKSKYSKNNSGDCLWLQIELNGNKHVVFTGSDVLIGLIKKTPSEGFPFSAKIVKS